MRVLVTGGAGFIGSHFCDFLLDKKNEVVAIDNLILGRMNNISSALKNTNFKFIKMDLLNKEALQKIFSENSFDLVLHLAANSDIEAGTTDLSRDLNLNFMTTINVLECMKKTGVKKIIFSSTSAIYGESDQILSEDTGPLLPISFYGASKLSAEAYISAYSNDSDIQTWLFRFPNVIGSRATHGVVYNLFHQLRKDDKELLLLADGKQEKPYLHVSELIEAIYFCFKNSNDKMNYFNIGCNTSTTVTKIGQLVVKRYGKPVPLTYTGGIRGWKGDVRKYQFNLDKVNKLGWKAKLSSDEAVEKAVSEIYKEIIGKED